MTTKHRLLSQTSRRSQIQRYTNLPQLLRRPLLKSASATKQMFNAKIKKLWAEKWNQSPRKNRLDQFGKNFPFKKFTTNLLKLTQKQTSIILQIRCGHFPLNQYLHKIKKVASNTCQACLAANIDTPSQETIHHFIFTCQAYTTARNILKEKIGQEHFNLPNIMSSPII